MPQIVIKKVNPIEKAIYRCVAFCKGDSGMHAKIISELAEKFDSKNQVTRIMKGTTNISQDDLKTIKAVLIEYDPTITIDDLI